MQRSLKTLQNIFDTPRSAFPSTSVDSAVRNIWLICLVLDSWNGILLHCTKYRGFVGTLQNSFLFSSSKLQKTIDVLKLLSLRPKERLLKVQIVDLKMTCAKRNLAGYLQQKKWYFVVDSNVHPGLKLFFDEDILKVQLNWKINTK